MKRMKWLVSAALASAMLMVMAGNVYAKNEDPITGVDIELDYEDFYDSAAILTAINSAEAEQNP